MSTEAPFDASGCGQEQMVVSKADLYYLVHLILDVTSMSISDIPQDCDTMLNASCKDCEHSGLWDTEGSEGFVVYMMLLL